MLETQTLPGLVRHAMGSIMTSCCLESVKCLAHGDFYDQEKDKWQTKAASGMFYTASQVWKLAERSLGSLIKMELTSHPGTPSSLNGAGISIYNANRTRRTRSGADVSWHFCLNIIASDTTSRLTSVNHISVIVMWLNTNTLYVDFVSVGLTKELG